MAKKAPKKAKGGAKKATRKTAAPQVKSKARKAPPRGKKRSQGKTSKRRASTVATPTDWTQDVTQQMQQPVVQSPPTEQPAAVEEVPVMMPEETPAPQPEAAPEPAQPETPAAVEEKPIDLPPPGLGVLQVTLKKLFGALTNTEVLLCYQGRAFEREITDAHGIVTFSHLAPGKYQLVVIRGSKTVTKDVVAAADLKKISWSVW